MTDYDPDADGAGSYNVALAALRIEHETNVLIRALRRIARMPSGKSGYSVQKSAIAREALERLHINLSTD